MELIAELTLLLLHASDADGRKQERENGKERWRKLRLIIVMMIMTVLMIPVSFLSVNENAATRTGKQEPRRVACVSVSLH
jgi:zona occludens toxin (predicted ATPase)